MGAGNVSRVLKVPGRLVANPQDLGQAFPYEGTQIGLVRSIVVQSIGLGFRVESEGLGAVSDVLTASQRHVMSCFLRGWDDDAISLLLPGHYTEGDVSGHARLDIPGPGTQPGASALSSAPSLLYVPDNPIDAPALLVRRAVVEWGDASEIAFARGSELGIPLTVECVQDATGTSLQIGRLVDLTLS
jgi:hypothetical protein